MSDPIYNPTWQKPLYRALRMVGAYDAAKNPRAEQVEQAVDILNMLLKQLQIENVLWLKQFATLFLNKGQTSYGLASLARGGSHCVTAYTQTTLSISAIAGAGSVTLTSSTGIATGDYIGIVNNSGTIEWFTATIAGNIATLSGTLTIAATAGNLIYAHTPASQIERPTRVFTAVRKMYDPIAENGIEVEIDLYSRAEYSYMPNKTITGKTVQAYYNPLLSAGILYVWPTADTPNDKLKLTVDRPIQAITTDTDTIDIPMEWLDAITFMLAERLWFEYPAGGADYAILLQRAALAKDAVSNYDRETAPAQYQMDYRY